MKGLEMSAITGIVTAGNGQEMFAGHRISAWDGAGQKFDKAIPARNVDEFLRLANLNFDFHYSPVFDELGNEIPKARSVYREIHGGELDGTRVHSGIVGDRHHQVQPRELGEFVKAALPDNLVSTGGMLKDTRMWLQLEGDKNYEISPNGVADKVRNFWTVTSTFDGSGSIFVGKVLERWNCRNVITGSMRGTEWAFKIRHTASVKDRLALAAKAIAAGKAYEMTMTEVMREMAEKPFTQKQFVNAVTTLNGDRPEDNVKGRETKWENMMESHMALWNAEHNENIKGTAYGAYQVLIERAQWGRNVQDTENGMSNFWSAGMGFDGPTNAYRQRSLDLVAARSGVKV